MGTDSGAESMVMLAIDNLSKVFPGGVTAVDDLSLEVQRGELLVLAGPSGCGKTTTLRMIAGLERPSQGSISIGGRTVDRLAPNDRDVSMVFQNFALYPHLSVFGNMAFGLKLRRLDRAKIESRVGEAAELLGIADLLARRPGELSGGQQQRVALGKAIVRKPKLFLFDEPLSNLDAPLRAKLRQEIRRLHQRLDATMLYVTHDQTEAMTLGRRIALMHEGRILQVAEPRQLYNRPANRHVAEMIGSPAMNLIDGRIRRSENGLIFDAKSFNIPLPREFDKQLGPYVDRPIVLGIRPEHVTPRAGAPVVEAPIEAPIEAIVEAIEPLGAETYIDLLVGQHAMTSRVAADHGLCSGQRVLLILATEKLHFFDPPSGRSLRQ